MGCWVMQVQHAGLRDSCTADTLTVDFLVKTVHFLFPKFDYSWLVDQIKESLPQACPHTPVPFELSCILNAIYFLLSGYNVSPVPVTPELACNACVYVHCWSRARLGQPFILC